MKRMIVYLDDKTPDDYLELLVFHILKDRYVKHVLVVKGGKNAGQGQRQTVNSRKD